MKKVSLAVLVSLSALTGTAYAQSGGGVMESTDPAKAADVEQRAQALQAQQESMPSGMAMPEKKSHRSTMHHKKPAAPADSATQ